MGRRKTNEEFISEMKIVNPSIIILGTYINNHTKIQCKCLKCGNIWFTRPNHLLEGHGCSECKKELLSKIKTLTHEEFVERMREINPNIKMIGHYINAKTKIECECLIDGNCWFATPTNLLSGRGCSVCNIASKAYTHQQFAQLLNNINPNIEILSEYIHSTQKVKCKCLIDGNIWFAEPRQLLQGRGCPKCNLSKGELKVSKFLDNYNINYIPQYKFKDCVYICQLPFDFYLPDYNICIEYDGKQHYQSMEYFGGETRFATQQQKDNIKTQYCQENKIKLLRIPYWDFDNIESILNKELNELYSRCS